MKYKLFIDFDGTITTVDTLEFLLSTFADNRWAEIEEKIGSSEIAEIEGLKEQFKLINLGREEALARLDEVVEFDPYFNELLQLCRKEGISITIVSGGFHWIISYFLKKNGVQRVNLKCNDAIVRDGKWEIIPGGSSLDCKKCNHCKTQYIRFAKERGFKTIYVGDGNTDRCPSKEADIIFAKGVLKEFCNKEKLQFFPYNNLHEVCTQLENMLKETISANAD